MIEISAGEKKKNLFVSKSLKWKHFVVLVPIQKEYDEMIHVKIETCLKQTNKTIWYLIIKPYHTFYCANKIEETVLRIQNRAIMTVLR